MKINLKKSLGIVVPLIALGATALSNWWSNENQKEEIKKQISEELAKLNKN